MSNCVGLIPAGALKGSWGGRLCKKAKDEALEGDSGNLGSPCPTETGCPGNAEWPGSQEQFPGKLNTKRVIHREKVRKYPFPACEFKWWRVVCGGHARAS